jgi:hypothetical protein
MNYIGNFKDWITPGLMGHLTTHSGDLTPVWQPDRWTGHPILEEFKEKARPVYSKDTPTFHQFNSRSKDMENFPITLPVLPETRKSCHWWFIKLLAGEMQAMHVDPHLLEVKNPVRYTMFLQDFQLGHVFVYDQTILKGYKAGDVYEWSDPMCLHGCINIGYQTRYTLQVTYHD